MKRNLKKLLPGAALAAFAAAVIVYGIMLNAQKNILTGYEKSHVLFASGEIKEGVELTADNVSEYVELREMDKALISESTVTDMAMLLGQIVAHDIDGGTLLTKGMFLDVRALKENMEEPVVAGFMADDLYQVVSGVLRSGDKIHIYTVDKESGNAYLIWENVLVQAVFDNAGTAVAAEDTQTAAGRINVLLEKKHVEQFYSELAAGSLRVVQSLE